MKINRTYSLDIQTTVAGSSIVVKNPLTCEFSVQRNIFASQNTSLFRVYNLSELTRNAVYKDEYDLNLYRTCVMRAGYENFQSIIFSGNIKKAFSYRRSGDVNFVTEIEAYDNSYATAASCSEWQIQNQVSKAAVINRLIGELKGVTRGSVAEISGTYKRGFVAHGFTWDILQEVTGGQCFIDNGKVNVLEENDCISGGITILNSNFGLMGTPRRQQNILKAEIIFEPRLMVGQSISLNSDTIPEVFNGTYKIVGIEHSGVISEAVGGTCKTSVSLLLPTDRLNSIISSGEIYL